MRPVYGGTTAQRFQEDGGFSDGRVMCVHGTALEYRRAQMAIDLLYGSQIGKGFFAIATQHCDIDDAGLAVHTVDPRARQGALTIEHEGLQTAEQGAGVQLGLAQFLLAHGLRELLIQPQAGDQHQHR